MTLQEACELSYKVWFWLFQNPGKNKHESPYWKLIKSMDGYCPLCEIMRGSALQCTGCVGDLKGGCFGNAIELWCTNYSCKPAAAHIAFTIRKFMRKQGWCV